mgnify:CR=1 FL=1
MAYEVLTKRYKSGGVSSRIKEVKSKGVDREREFESFTAYYRYAESLKEAEVMQFHNKGGRERVVKNG